MSTPPNLYNNIWARLKSSIPGIPVGNTFAMYGPNGSLGAIPGSSGLQWYVDAQNGDDSNGGRDWSDAKATMGGASGVFADSDFSQYATINIEGVTREQVTAPQDVFDVTIIGRGNTPRQATDGGVPTGGGSCWLAPTSPVAATPLLTLREQGWSVLNLFMAAATDAPCIKLVRQEIAAAMDASHFSAMGCVFGGGLIGIEDSGGNGFLQIIGNRFQNLTETTGYAIKNTSTAIAAPLQWQVMGNLFRNNKNHILAPCSQAEFSGNDFGIVGNTITAVIALSLTGGLNNSVFLNALNRPANTSPNATLYVGGTNDLWYQNYGTDAVIYGVPDNS